FIRIADDGRGVDSGRTLLSSQSHALQNFTGTMTVRPGVGASGAGVGMVVTASGALSINPLSSGNFIPVQATGSTGFSADVVTLNPSNVANTADETRPRNIAFNFLVRAK